MRTRIMLCEWFSAWKDGQIPAVELTKYRTQLTQCRPRPSGWLALVTSLQSVVAGETRNAIEHLDLQNETLSSRPYSAREMAVLLGWTSALRDSLGQGGGRDWARAVDILRATGATLPPELKILKNRWGRPSIIRDLVVEQVTDRC